MANLTVPTELVELIEWLTATVARQDDPNWQITLNANGSRIGTEVRTIRRERDARGHTVIVETKQQGEVRCKPLIG